MLQTCSSYFPSFLHLFRSLWLWSSLPAGHYPFSPAEAHEGCDYELRGMVTVVLCAVPTPHYLFISLISNWALKNTQQEEKTEAQNKVVTLPGASADHSQNLTQLYY